MRLRLLPLAALLACNPSFTPQYRVDDLRILGVRAEAPPDAAYADALPGGRVRLRALVANPRGRAPVVYRWYACAPSGDEGVAPCLDPAALRDPSRLDEVPGILALGAGEGLDVLDVSVPDVRAALDHVIALAQSEPAYACRLYVEAPLVLVVEADGRREVAVRTVRLGVPPEEVEDAGLADVYVRNLNPEVQALRLHPTLEDGCDGLDLRVGCLSDEDCGGAPCLGAAPGEPGTCPFGAPELPSGTFDLCAWPDWRRIQRYATCGPDGTVEASSETPSWQWYVTAGEIDDASSVGNATGERITLSRDPGPFTLWVIVRDGRGGEGWMRVDFPAGG